MHTKTLRAAVLTIALAAIGGAHAAPPIGSGGGYYGTAEYGDGMGSTVGPYATWAECNAALQAAIYNNVHNFGYTLESMHPCSYTPPFSGVMHEWFELQVLARTPRESAQVGKALLEEVRRIRDAHRADAYEAAIGELVRIAAPSTDGDARK